MAANSHRYQEVLNKGQIRLLNLKAGHEQDDIGIEFKISNLTHMPLYEALSYEWVTTRKTNFVMISGYGISITHSLYLFLKRIRDSSQPRTLWIDAISINQEDSLEKSQQIPLVADIFGKATRVLIWLGPQVSRPHDVFRTLYALAKLWIRREVRKAREGEFRPLSWTDVDLVEAIALQPWDDDLWIAIYVY